MFYMEWIELWVWRNLKDWTDDGSNIQLVEKLVLYWGCLLQRLLTSVSTSALGTFPVLYTRLQPTNHRAMASSTTASQAELKAYRVPLGWRDSCSAYVFAEWTVMPDADLRGPHSPSTISVLYHPSAFSWQPIKPAIIRMLLSNIHPELPANFLNNWTNTKITVCSFRWTSVGRRTCIKLGNVNTSVTYTRSQFMSSLLSPS